jgi:bifunctional DNase/RNase
VLIEMKIGSISIDPIFGVPIIYLQDATHKQADVNLVIYIGLFEAKAISTALNDGKPTRPYPYDIMVEMLKLSDLKITRVIISDLRERTFYGIVEVTDGKGNVKQIDSRVSDAIALAVRVGVKIFTTDLVIKKAKRGHEEAEKEAKKIQEDERLQPPPSPPENLKKEDKLKSWLENLKPEDFKNA